MVPKQPQKGIITGWIRAVNTTSHLSDFSSNTWCSQFQHHHHNITSTDHIERLRESPKRAKMSSILESFQKPSFFPSRPFNDSLPVSSQDHKYQQEGSIRRRLSSISMKIQRPNIPSSSSSWEFIRRSKSLSSMKVESAGNSMRKWWDWGWGWILSRKPTFARDLEMNEEETAMLGCHNKGSWKHVIYKVRSELRKLVGFSNVSSAASPVFAYDSYSYAQNFDDGNHSRHG